MDTTTPVPLKTTDAILAYCLRMVGVPMLAPPMNVYTEDILKRLGYEGHTVREAAIEADAAKEKGRVEYWFNKTPESQAFIDIYHKQETEIKAEGDDRDAGERIREIMARATRPETDRPEYPGEIMDEREALLRVLCISQKMFVPFKNQFKEWTSFLEIEAPKPSKQISKNVTRFYPGLTRVPVNADDQMLKDLKLL